MLSVMDHSVVVPTVLLDERLRTISKLRSMKPSRAPDLPCPTIDLFASVTTALFTANTDCPIPACEMCISRMILSEEVFNLKTTAA
jgi:hypothetical protein